MPEDKSWEIISTYLLYGFRGSPESLKEIIALTEEKNFKIFTDMYYFYYRERQFLLKTWYHILTNMEGHKYCVSKLNSALYLFYQITKEY